MFHNSGIWLYSVNLFLSGYMNPHSSSILSLNSQWPVALSNQSFLLCCKDSSFKRVSSSLAETLSTQMPILLPSLSKEGLAIRMTGLMGISIFPCSIFRSKGERYADAAPN